MIDQLAAENPKVPSNMLHALTTVRLSQLMDRNKWDFKNLEKQQVMDNKMTEVELEVFAGDLF